jgi:hypothetical protein
VTTSQELTAAAPYPFRRAQHLSSHPDIDSIQTYNLHSAGCRKPITHTYIGTQVQLPIHTNKAPRALTPNPEPLSCPLPYNLTLPRLQLRLS